MTLRFPSFLLPLFAALSLSAQPAASISGTVTDPSGAIVALAPIAIHNLDSDGRQTVTASPDGQFEFPALPPGRYQVEIELPAFQSYRSPILTASAAPLRLDIQLALAPQAEVVTVTESAAAIETSSSQIGDRIAAGAIAQLPVNGRSFTQLLAVQPGVMPASSQQSNAVVMSGCTSAPPSGADDPGNVSVTGHRETANGFFVNGITAQEDFNMGAAIVPTLDSIADIQVLTGNFDAEYGNYSGGQVLVTTKSGGNELHGSAFEFLRNTALDARNFFAAARARYARNQFGGALGGAIRKNKLFFFADYEASRMIQGIDTGLIPVPSLANRAGDFTANAAVLTGTVSGPYWAGLLTQKLGYAVTPGEPYYTPGCVTSTQCALPNGQIPQRAWSAPARSLLGYIPQPNRAGNLFSTSAYDEQLRDGKGAIRLDWQTRLGALDAYYFDDDYNLDNPYPQSQGGANVPGFNALSLGRAQLASLALTTAFQSGAMNELRLGYMRTANNIGRPAGGVGPSLASQGFTDAAGSPAIVPLAPSIEGIENVAFNSFTIGVDTTGAAQANNTFQIADSFTRIAGPHTVKFGINLHRDQVNINPDAIYNGSFLFKGSETGSDFADFLLGIASSYSQGDSRAFYLRNQYAGVFAQDSWRLAPGLTLNYGVRWDLLPPWREKYDQLQTLVPGQQSVVYPGAPAGLVFPGDPGIPSTLAPARYSNFAPRIGLAWSPAPQTSIRAGYGIFYTAFEGLSAGIMSANPPYGYDYNSLAPPLFSTPFVTAAGGEDIGQRFPEPIPASGASATRPNASLDWSQYLPITGVPSFFHRNVSPYSSGYTLSIERELGRDTLLTASYAGSQSHHLLVLVSANPGDPALCLSLSQPRDVMPGTPVCGPFGESGTYVSRSGQVYYGTRGPFSSAFAAVTYQKTIGNSNFNSLQVSLRRSTRSLEWMAGYTYGKSIDQSSSLSEPVNPLNANLTRAISAFDLRHNFVTSYSWKLPVPSRMHAPAALLNGWALTGITRFSTGFPVTLYNDRDTSLLGAIPNGINNNGVDTPDYIPGNLRLNTDARNGLPAFNAGLFRLPDLGTIGTASRRMFYGPGIVNFDAALHKQLRLREARSLEIRLEAFNLFNHAQFYGPSSVSGDISSANFGQVISAAAPRLVQLAAKLAF